jgi:hypothetical protein
MPPRGLRSRGVWRTVAAWLCLLLAGMGSRVAGATDTLVLGVFRYRPEAVMLRRFEPLADDLSAHIPGAPPGLSVH